MLFNLFWKGSLSQWNIGNWLFSQQIFPRCPLRMIVFSGKFESYIRPFWLSLHQQLSEAKSDLSDLVYIDNYGNLKER